MYRTLTLILLLALAFSSFGCGTIYSAAVDERNVSTIADDHAIVASVKKAHFDDPIVSILDITVYSFEGRVYLIGEYDSLEQKERAISLARQVEGVRSVHTYLLPERDDPACGTTDNLTIQATVTKELIADDDIWSTQIKVDSVQCNVVLTGIVGSQAEIDRAVAHARGVEGVRSVKSFLRVSGR